LLLLTLTAAAPGAENPAGALAAAAGHPARHHLRAQANRVSDGQTESATLEVDGTSRLERQCHADLCEGTWFDGSQSFAFGINGTPLHERQRDEGAERTFAAIASTAFAEPGFVGAGGQVTALPATGAGSARYRVSAPGGADLVAVADARTQRLEAVERPDGSVYATLVASGTASALVYGTRAYDSVAVMNEPLAAPSGPPVLGANEGEIGLAPGPLPIVPCRLAGRDAACLIDSGTTPSALTLAFAERIEREPRGTIAIEGLGSYVTGVVDADPLDVGGAHIGGLHFAVIPHVRGADFDVILGSDVLARLRIELDAGRRRARIGPAGGQPAGDPIAVDFIGGLPFTDVRLRDRAPEPLLIDTGDSATLSIGYDEYRLDTSLFAPRGASRVSGAGSVTMDGLDGELPHVDFGPARFNNVAITAVRGQHRGHLGYGFAARCGRLVLDFGERRIECRRTVVKDSGPAGQR
jgi:hypothetical protein